jgi:glycosyltransferase involved in cell wall biosynthesis
VTVAPLISVIVPCYHDPESLDALLRSLAAQAPPSEERRFEVVVVDSGMDDAVVATAERFGARCVRGTERLLAGDARNLGARSARGSVLAFIDADCVAEPGWVGAIAEAFANGAFMVGGPVLNRLPPRSIASVDNLLQFADFGPDRRAGTIRHVPACNVAIRCEDFSALGGFVHCGQTSGEDVLLTEAANASRPGGLLFVPEMRVAHHGRATFSEMLDHQHAFGYARGALGLHLSANQQRWGRWIVILPGVILKRLTYVCRRGVRYGRITPPQLMLAMPLILCGVWAWALGFRRGLKSR